MQFGRPAADQRICGKRHDDDRERAFDEAMVAFRQQHETQRYAEQRRNHEPSRAAHVDVPPVLCDDDRGDSNRNQHGQRGCDANGDTDGEQRNGD